MRILVGLTILFFISTSVWAQKQAPGQLPLFTIDNQTVFVDEFIYVYQKNNLIKNAAVTESPVLEYLELFTNFKLKIADAKKNGLDTTASFIKEFSTYKAELKKPYQAQSNELDQLVKEAYERLTEEVRASHILIMTSPDSKPDDTLKAFTLAQELRSKVIAGNDFASLAREFSQDPTAKQNDGDLGFFTTFQMVYPFESAAYRTKIGEIAPITRTRFGYHIIKVFDRQPARGEVEVSHILVRTNDQAKSKILLAFDQLKAGRTWDEVCAEFSDDQNTKNNGGRLRTFGIGALASIPEFENSAFSLKSVGDVSDPFSSSIGWHIVRLEKKIPVPSFTEMEPALKGRISRDERLQISKEIQLNKKKKMFEFQEVDSVKRQVFALADSSLLIGKWKYSGPTELNRRQLLRAGSRTHSVGDFVKYVNKNQSTSGLKPSDYFNQLYNQFCEGFLDELEDKKLMDENPEFRFVMREYYEGILLFEIMESEVWNRASVDSVGQRKYYEENREKYNAGNRVDARIFSVKDSLEFIELNRRATGADSHSLKDMKNVRVINFRRYQKGESSTIDQIPWLVGTHKTENEGMYYLVEIRSLVPPGIRDFDEVRANIISDYQDFLEKEWVIALRSKYGIKSYNKGKKAVLKSLITRK